MLKIAIVDDEEMLAKKLAKIVSDYMSRENYPFEVDIFTSGIEFTTLGSAMTDYKIVCLDIKMDQMDGMEVARRINQYDSDTYIIFITAFMDYSLAGYRAGAIRFILKDDPVFEETMHEALKAVCMKINDKLASEMFHFKEGNTKLFIKRIVYVETGIHKVIFHVWEDSTNRIREYNMSETLGNIEERFRKYGFIRMHKSYLVNYRYIERIKNYKAILLDQTILPIPKNKFREVMREYLLCQGRD